MGDSPAETDDARYPDGQGVPGKENIDDSKEPLEVDAARSLVAEEASFLIV